MIKVPEKLIRYVDFEEGKIISVDLPEELKAEFEKFKEKALKAMREELADY